MRKVLLLLAICGISFFPSCAEQESEEEIRTREAGDAFDRIMEKQKEPVPVRTFD